MSPLQSYSSPYPVYNQDSDHSSKTPTSKYHEYDSDPSTNKSEGPKSKKQRRQSPKTNLPKPLSPTYIISTQSSLHSSDEGNKSKLIISKTQTKHKHKTASQEQIDSLKSTMISLQEFLNLYNSLPKQGKNKQFYTACKIYLHKVSKTKSSIKEKKEMFLSLPQAIKTSFSLFELMFKQEFMVLSNITSGKTDICNLQNSIDTLLTFFPPSYIQRKMTLFVKHKQGISPQEKRILSACRRNLRQLEKQSKILLQSSEKTCSSTINKPSEYDTTPSNDDQQAQERIHKYKQNLTPEAKKILDSLADETVDSNDIVTYRRKLMSLKVDRQIIRRAFKTFKNSVTISHRPDKDYVLYKINEAIEHTSTIKINRLPFSNKLQNLYDQALAGTLPLHCINELRYLMFKDNPTVTASSSFRTAKRALIRHNKDKEKEIKDAFKQAQTQSSTLSNTYKHLQTKIKAGNLNTTEFTSIYDSIPQSDRTGTLSKMCSKYITVQLKNTTSFKDKTKLLRALPQSLQKSHSIINLIFPDESAIISSIRNGKLPSSDIKKHLTQLLQIIDTTHLEHILHQYVTVKKPLTSDEKIDISKCRREIKILEQVSQPRIDTHTTDASKSQYKQQDNDTSEANKPQMSKMERQHVAECIGMVLNIQRRAQSKDDNDIKELPYVKDKKGSSTRTYQYNKSLIPTTSKQTETSTTYKTYEEEQVTLTTQLSPTPEASTSTNSDTHICAHHSSLGQYTQPDFYEMPSSILEHYTDSPSPQPSTSYSIENRYKTTKPLSLAQIPSDELTYILRSIVNEDEYEDEDSEDSLILHQYILKLAQELQQEPENLEQSIFQLAEEASTSKSPSCTDTINPQYTHTNEQRPDCKILQTHENFFDI